MHNLPGSLQDPPATPIVESLEQLGLQLQGRSRTSAIRMTLRSSIRATWQGLWRLTKRFANAWYTLLIGALFAIAPAALPAQADSIVAIVTNNVLTITGTTAADTITLSEENGNVKINGQDPNAGAVSSNSLTGIVINAGDGSDTIDVSSVLRSSFTLVHNGSALEINAGLGNDTVIASANVSGTTDGGGGSDLLRVTADGEIILTSTNLSIADMNRSFTAFEKAELNGSSGDDTLNASQATIPVTLNGGAGSDLLRGGSANDIFNPGADGSASTDIVIDQSQSDTDTLIVTANSDMTVSNQQISLGNSSILLNGFIEQFILTGGASANTIDASGYTNGAIITMIGLDGNDTLTGSANGDTFEGGIGDDTITGGNGTDTVRQTADSNMVLSDTQLTGQGTDTLSSIERAILTGGAGNNSIDALNFSGSVIVDAMGGNDTVRSGAGDDTLNGGDGNDTFEAIGNVNMVLTNTNFSTSTSPAPVSAGGTDTVSNFENATLQGGESNNTINASGFSGPVMLYGLGGNDTLTGSASTDSISGGDGNDSINGGDGNDSINGGDGNDSIAAGTGDDTVYGGAGDDTLNGEDGNDTMYGEAGNDTLIGGPGNNTLSGGTGTNSQDEYKFVLPLIHN